MFNLSGTGFIDPIIVDKRNPTDRKYNIPVTVTLASRARTGSPAPIGRGMVTDFVRGLGYKDVADYLQGSASSARP